MVALRLATAVDLSDALTRLAACRADPDLIAVARRCLAENPEDRPADAGAVAELIAAHRTGVEERARRAELARAQAETRSAEQQKRRRTQLALAATVGLLLLGGGAFAWWQDRQAERTKRLQAEFEAEQTRQEARRREQQQRVHDGVT
jgi:hypothetical protein